jgi:hypothetical protein
MPQVLTPAEPFDAVVVGSGATGGWAAKRLPKPGGVSRNSTLTMMAITVRACDYITKEYAKQL